MRSALRACRGQVMTEFALVSAALVLALFVPRVGEEPAALWLLRELAAVYTRWSFAISIL
ncbi:MAG: hypothetical protein RL030_243 [Pseudomonadota bacterium]